MMTRLIAGALASLSIGLPAHALTSPFKNMGEIARTAGFDAYGRVRGERTVKIAVLDNGFKGYRAAIGKSLPSNTKYHAGPIPVDPKAEEAHGTFMAQLVAGLMDRAPGVKYEMHLFSAFGYSNLDAAVTTVIQQKFDVVLYAQVWEYGGNGDGRGFINTLVDRATRAGISWVNASGNFGTGTYLGVAEIAEDGWAKLPGENQSLRLRCRAGKGKKCQMRAVLSWNDFSDDMNEGSDKDLDLVLTDDTLRIVKTSGFVQKKTNPNSDGTVSLYPREIVQAEIEPGLHYLRVKARSSNFYPENDQIRVTVSGENVDLVDMTQGESLLAPADNEGVISIGAADSEKSSESLSSGKPELKFPSKVILGNGDTFKGSSNSSAIAAAAVLLLKGLDPSVSRESLIRQLKGSGYGQNGNVGQGLPLQVLQFGPTGQNCFQVTRLPHVPAALRPLIGQGVATAVVTTAGYKVFTEADPYSMVQDVERHEDDDVLIATDTGFESWARSEQSQVPSNAVEVVQTPAGQIVCPIFGENKKSASPGLRLPPLAGR